MQQQKTSISQANVLFIMKMSRFTLMQKMLAKQIRR